MTFPYSIGQIIKDIHPVQAVAQTWDDFVAVFDCAENLRSEAKGGRYICAPMRHGQHSSRQGIATWRQESLADSCNWLAFDFDKLPNADYLSDLVGWFEQVSQCFWYPTASSTPENPRIRVIVALDRCATPNERQHLCQAVGNLLGEYYPRDTNQDRASQPLYLPLRGAAVTRCDIVGQLSVDAWLPHFTPKASASSITFNQQWTEIPCEDWSGPEDDEELIRQALNSKSANNIFGKKASFADLWTGNISALSQCWSDSSGTRPYDCSSADAALAQHLAFWTGNNCERISRLMERSSLKRDK